MSNDSIIAREKVVYLIDKANLNISGVLEAENLLDRIPADYKFDRVDGPFRVEG